MATCSRAPLAPSPSPVLPAGLAGSGMKGDPSVPAPEMEEVKPRASLAPAADLARPGRMFRPRVSMTKEEEASLVEVTARHMSGRKELQARIARRNALSKRVDEVLFKRRCWAATLANHVFTLRADVAHVKHQLRVGWKEGDPLPEELVDARRRIGCAFIMNEHIGKVMDMGLDSFAGDYCEFYEKKICPEVEDKN